MLCREIPNVPDKTPSELWGTVEPTTVHSNVRLNKPCEDDDMIPGLFPAEMSTRRRYYSGARACILHAETTKNQERLAIYRKRRARTEESSCSTHQEITVS